MAENEEGKKYSFKKIILFSGAFVLLVLISIGTFFAFKFLGNPMRAESIYLQAMKDYENEDYSNAYFQFSKVSFLSDLKPYAIYKRAECAKMLGDAKSEMKQYHLLFNLYSDNVLALKAKYLYANDFVDSNPALAKKLLEELITESPDSDYGIGANYHLANLLIKKYPEEYISSEQAQAEISNYLRTYLSKAPTGRWALKALDLWQNSIEYISVEDKILIADILLRYNRVDEAIHLLENVKKEYAWASLVNAYIAKKEYKEAKSVLEYGLGQKEVKVSNDDKINAVAKYINIQKDKKAAVEGLYTALNGRKDDYIYMLKCRWAKNENIRQTCFSLLPKAFELKDMSEPVLFEIFMAHALNARSADALEIGSLYEKMYPNSVNTPQVLYWMGTMYKKRSQNERANDYFKKTIVTFPDSYYSLRSYLKLNDINNSIITTVIEPKEVIFPYYGNVSPAILKLVEYGDLSTLAAIYENDKFVQSWILYEKGDISKAMVIARDAMAELPQKPDKSDLRWRLVYPVNMFNDIKKYADIAGNNTVLMLALTREESYFNQNAHSYVGATGLMQIMPATAKEISKIKNLPQYSIDELKTSDVNLKLGNYYYNFLLKNLGNNNILSVAAYNGGIGSINRWKKGLEYQNIDEFIEKIPYPETKNYVKKVFRTYWNYTRIYL